MKNYYISINQFAEFSKSTLASKKRILKQQVVPNKFLIPWYQTARGAMKKYFRNINNLTPLDEAIDLLTNKPTANKRQQIDKKVSLEALNQLKEFAFPPLLRDIDFEIIKPTTKDYEINNVSIIVAPDVVLKGVYNGDKVFGAIKIHICKSKPFDEHQSKHVSNLIYKYMLREVKNGHGIVLPELCICLDIFSGRITPASVNLSKENIEIKKICEEIKTLWAA